MNFHFVKDIFHKNSQVARVLFLISFLIISFSASAASDSEQEEEFLPSFRSGHNISLLLSEEYSHWSLNQTHLNYAPGANQSNLSSIVIDPAEESKLISAFFFRYSYHINILSGFGFFVGSTVGFFLSNGNYGASQNFYPGFGVSFPTVMGGLVQNIGQKFRILSGIEYGAAWFPKMHVLTQSGDSKNLAPVPDMASFYVGLDHFYSNNKAMSLYSGYRQILNTCLSNCSTSLYLNSLNIKDKSIYVQFGLTWIVGSLNSD
jgi:hypothetical protein